MPSRKVAIDGIAAATGTTGNVLILEGGYARSVPKVCPRRLRRSGVLGGLLLGVLVTVVWAATGSYFDYSDTRQLVINTGTSIGTLLIVFLIQIQNTQNRDAKVMQLKLDELIRAVSAARTELVQMKSLTDSELDQLPSGPATDQFRLQLHAEQTNRFHCED
jgi:low affinity Fe/Cu permease